MSQLSTLFREDAGKLCGHLCDMLNDAITGISWYLISRHAPTFVDGPNYSDAASKELVFIARICQELGSASGFFTRVGCDPDIADGQYSVSG